LEITPSENGRMSPKKGLFFHRKYIFQPLIFRGGLLVFGGALCITKVASLYPNWAGWCVPCVFAPNPPAVQSKRTWGQKSHLHWSLYFGGFMFYKICNHWNLSKLAVLMLYFDWIWFWRHVFISIQAAFHFAIKTLRSKVNLIFSPPRTQGLSGKDQRFTPQFYDLSFFSPKKKNKTKTRRYAETLAPHFSCRGVMDRRKCCEALQPWPREPCWRQALGLIGLCDRHRGENGGNSVQLLGSKWGWHPIKVKRGIIS